MSHKKKVSNAIQVAVIVISASFSPDIGGLETHLLDLVKVLHLKEYKVIVVSFQPYQTPAKLPIITWSDRSVLVIRLPRLFRQILFKRGQWNPVGQSFYQPLLLLALSALLLRNRHRVVAIHVNGISVLPFVSSICHLFGTKCILSIHYQYERITVSDNFGYRFISRAPDELLTLSRKASLKLKESGVSGDARVFRYWIDLDKFKPIDMKEKRRILGVENKFLVLFVGRLIEEKGIRIVLELSRRYEGDPRISFLIIGDGPFDMAKAIRELHPSNLKYEGSIPNDEMPSWYNVADVLIVPSLGEEGFGRVIPEALSCGIPVIASNTGGIPEILDSSVGLLTTPSVESFKQRIDELINSPDRLNLLRAECRKYAERTFDISNFETILESYLK